MVKNVPNRVVQECISLRMSYAEAIHHIKKETGEDVHGTWYKDRKTKLLNNKSMNAYFDDHLRVGFMRDYQVRKLELETVLDKLMHRWYSLVDIEEGEPEPNIVEMRMLASSINDINRSLREISLDNPIIAGIRAKIEEHDRPIQAGEASSIDITQGTAFS